MRNNRNTNEEKLETKTSPINGTGFIFSARCNIYISRLYYTMSVAICLSVCDGSALWSRSMPGTQRLRQPAKLTPSYDPQQTWPPPMLRKGSSRAMLATARPSCFLLLRCHCNSEPFLHLTAAWESCNRNLPIPAGFEVATLTGRLSSVRMQSTQTDCYSGKQQLE